MTRMWLLRWFKVHWLLASACLLVALLLTLSLGDGLGHAQTATMTVSASKTQLAPGETFSVSIRQNVGESVLGAQGNLYFDQTRLKVVSIETGDEYADAQFFVGQSVDGVVPTVEEAIAAGNASGLLANIANFYLPGTGSVPAGDAEVAQITMQVLTTAPAGSTELRFDSRQVNVCDPLSGVCTPETQGVGFVTEADTNSLLPASVTQARVTVVAGATPAPTTTTDASVTPTRTRRPIPSGDSTADPSLGEQMNLTVTPESLEIAAGQSATAIVELDSPVPVTGAAFTLAFDHESLKVTKIEPGEDWSVSGQSGYASKITEANSSGELKGLTITQRASADPVPKGKTELFTITFEPVSDDGSSDLELSNGSVLDENGIEIPIGTVGGVQIDESGGGGGSGGLLIIVGAVLGLAVLGGGGFFAWRTMNEKRWEE